MSEGATTIAPVVPTNDPQQAAVVAHERGALVVTGKAGTGKTWALQERFVRLLDSGIDSSRVALVVRSKAERIAIRDALQERIGATSELHVLTIHALAFAVAGQLGIGGEEPIEVLDATEQFALVRELLEGEDPGEWPAYGQMLHSRGFAEQVRTFLLRAQESAQEPDVIAARAAAAGLSGFAELAGFYQRYLDVLAATGRTDYPGLVLHAAAAAHARTGDGSFDHVMVDDHHDTTLAAHALIESLAPTSLVFSGRLDGHVFSFTGTTDAPFRALVDDPDVANVELPVQHRGTPSLRAWSSVHPSDEFTAVARELRRVHFEEGVPWHDLAVVARRADLHLTGIIRALDDAAIPRVAPENARSLLVEAGTMPYVTALRWCARPEQRDLLAEPLLSSELTRLTPAEARSLVRSAKVNGKPPREAFDHAAELHLDAAQTVKELRDALAAASATAEGSVGQTFRSLWHQLPHSRRLVEAEARGDATARRDLDAILALAATIADHDGSADPSTEAFLVWLEAGAEGPGLAAEDERRDAVRVLTAHGTAGREFDSAIIIGASEGNFPSVSRPEPMFDLAALDGPILQAERTRQRLEDEGRLFELVTSRARRTVLCTASDEHDPAERSPIRSRFLTHVAWEAAPTPPFGDPVSAGEALALWRRILADHEASEVDRLVALEGLLAIGDDPSTWWYQRDWTDPGGRLKDQPRVSASRLSTLDDCELKFVLREELGLESGSSAAMWVGKAVHKIMEDADNGEIPRTARALSSTAHQRWRPEMFSSTAASNAWLRIVQDQILPRWLAEYGSRETLVAEQRFQFTFDDALVTGAIDRIGKLDEGTEITDYKTGAKPYGDAKIPDDNLQLALYYLALHEVPELQTYLPVNHIELAFVRHESKGRIVRVERDFTPDDKHDYESAIRERLSELIGHVNNLYDGAPIPPDPTANCRFCSFKPLCPLYDQSGDVLPEETSRTDAEDVA